MIDFKKLLDPDTLNTPTPEIIATSKMGGRTVVNEVLINALLSGDPISGPFVTLEEWKKFVPNPYTSLEGLSKEYIDALFEAFYQGAKARWDEAVGLAASKAPSTSLFSTMKRGVS
jgi:hypothetical protein